MLRFERDGVALVAIPMKHNFPLLAAVQAGILLGARIVLASSPDAKIVLPLVETERICVVPAGRQSLPANP